MEKFVFKNFSPALTELCTLLHQSAPAVVAFELQTLVFFLQVADRQVLLAYLG